MFEPYINLEEIASIFSLDPEICLEFVEFGLIDIQSINEKKYIAADQLQRIKQIVNLYKNLGVNKEGIEIILALRDQVQALKRERDRLTVIIQHMETEQHLRNIRMPAEQGLIIEVD